MKLTLTLLIISYVAAAAQAPKKDPLTKYRQLWEKSLVTVPPDPPEKAPEEVITGLDDYVLGGWTQTSQGYLVCLINSKNPKKRLTIAPGMPNKGGYQVVDVERDPMNYKASKVLVQLGVHKKWIGYEEKFLTLQQPPAATQRNKPAVPRTTQRKPPIPNANNSNKPATPRQPRVRRVPVPPKK